jgi:hypothetical protein
MMTSLAAKLAILGPPRLAAEIPAENAPARALFNACGWREGRTYVDLVCDSPTASPAPPGLVVPVTVDDLPEIALPAEGAPRSWNRTRATLINRKGRLLGLAVAGGERLDASVLYSREPDGGVAIWNVFVSEGTNGEAALGMVLHELAERERGRFVVPRIGEDEVPVEVLRRLGFSPSVETVGVAAEAHGR